jgi:hypothetical protein
VRLSVLRGRNEAQSAAGVHLIGAAKRWACAIECEANEACNYQPARPLKAWLEGSRARLRFRPLALLLLPSTPSLINNKPSRRLQVFAGAARAPNLRRNQPFLCAACSVSQTARAALHFQRCHSTIAPPPPPSSLSQSASQSDTSRFAKEQLFDSCDSLFKSSLLSRVYFHPLCRGACIEKLAVSMQILFA